MTESNKTKVKSKFDSFLLKRLIFGLITAFAISSIGSLILQYLRFYVFNIHISVLIALDILLVTLTQKYIMQNHKDLSHLIPVMYIFAGATVHFGYVAGTGWLRNIS